MRAIARMPLVFAMALTLAGAGCRLYPPHDVPPETPPPPQSPPWAGAPASDHSDAGDVRATSAGEPVLQRR